MYDGTINPTKFLEIYATTILFVGDNEGVMVSYFVYP